MDFNTHSEKQIGRQQINFECGENWLSFHQLRKVPLCVPNSEQDFNSACEQSIVTSITDKANIK